jgi:hypothetical protein
MMLDASAHWDIKSADLSCVQIPLERRPITMEEYTKNEDWSTLKTKLGI